MTNWRIAASSLPPYYGKKAAERQDNYAALFMTPCINHARTASFAPTCEAPPQLPKATAAPDDITLLRTQRQSKLEGAILLLVQ
jgi:hypothetical protein